MSNLNKENFIDQYGKTCLKMEFVAAGTGITPVDSTTGKRLSRPQMEYAKTLGVTETGAVRAVVTS